MKPGSGSLIAVVTLGLIGFSDILSWGQARSPNVLPLCRGPLHEGFAAPAVHTRHCDLPITAAPPAPLAEKPPPVDNAQKKMVWLPGYWSRDPQADEFLWVSGCWRKPPPGQRWLGGYWQSRGSGYVWVPGAWVDAGQAVALVPSPPKPRDESSVALAVSDEEFIVSGGWQFTEGEYRWRPAFTSPLRDGWVWVPAHYTETANGFLYNDGFWDYDFMSRGQLFAPLRVTSNPETPSAGFAITPTIVLTPAVLFHLFVGPSKASYRFGDYYDAEDVVPWFAGRDPDGPPEPHLRYYQWKIRRDFPQLLGRWHDYFKAHPASRPARTPHEQVALFESHPSALQIRPQIALAKALARVPSTESVTISEHLISLSHELPETRADAERAIVRSPLPTHASLWKVPEVGFHAGPDFPIVVRISEDWLRTQVARTIDWDGDVRKVILQTRVYGKSHTSGHVSLDLLPCSETAKLRLAFVGRTVANTRGYRRPVVIDTTTWTDFENQLDVEFDAETGLQAGAGSIVSTTGSRINCVATNRGGLIGRIIRRIAWRQINALRGRANAITNSITQADVAAGFRKQTTATLAHTTQQMDLPHLLPGVLTDNTNGTRHICSTDDALLICVGGRQRVVPALPLADSPADLQLWVHSSVMSDEFSSTLTGMDTMSRGLALLASSDLLSSSGMVELVGKPWLPIERVDHEGEWTILQLKESVIKHAFAGNPAP